MIIPDHITKFVREVEAYYGEYRPAVRAAVVEELGKLRWPSQRACDEMIVAMRRSYSTRWRTPPGVKEIIEAYDEVPPAPWAGTATDAMQITDDAGAPEDERYVHDLLTAFRSGKIRRDDDEPDGRPTAYEFEQAWRERHQVAG